MSNENAVVDRDTLSMLANTIGKASDSAADSQAQAIAALDQAYQTRRVANALEKISGHLFGIERDLATLTLLTDVTHVSDASPQVVQLLDQIADYLGRL